MTAYYQEVCKLKDKLQGIELHHVPRKDNEATNFLTKLAARWAPSLDGVFINDLHEPSTHVLEGSIQTHTNANLGLEGSDLGASMMTSPTDVIVVALDRTNWTALLLSYLLEEILPLERTEARPIAQHTKMFVTFGNKLYK